MLNMSTIYHIIMSTGVGVTTAWWTVHKKKHFMVHFTPA